MSYQKLKERFDQMDAIGEAIGVLGWDMQTVMPRGGAEARARQLSVLELLRHEQLVDPQVADWLDQAEDGASALSEWDQANLREMRRKQIHASAVDPKLVEARSKAGSACFNIWQEARAKNDWESFRPAQGEVIALTLEAAQAMGEALGCSPYDAMLDLFEPGLQAAQIDQTFAVLRERLPGLLEQVLEKQASVGQPEAIRGTFKQADQERLGRKLMQVVGFDFEHGRLDVSAHPFCGGVPEDVRITTRYREDEFASAMMGVLHETGHALYERQLPNAWRGQPVGAARGMAIHESQSLLIEMQVCRSLDFLTFAAPIMAQELGGAGSAWSANNLYRHYTQVSRGLIRVDADEVSYPLHVILRYELEQAIFKGELQIEDLPDAWNDGMERLVGVRPSSFAEGCMQDVHWTDGAFGYFPSYTLGAIAASQLYASARQEHGEIPGEIRKGDFSTLRQWLRENVHSRASLRSSDQLLTDATGRSFDAEGFLAHLESRYLGG